MAVNDLSAQPVRRLQSNLKHAIKTLIADIVRVAVAVTAIAMAVVTGVVSSRNMIAGGSAISTTSFGPWTFWRDAGRGDADPYTRAHFAKSGTLRLSSDSAGVFDAVRDSSGAYLHSSCDYVIEGPYPQGLWWSFSVFDRSGKLIANDAARYAFTSDTAAANPDGSYIITLGRDARPGNWLPTGGAGRLIIVFTLLDPATGFSEEQRAERSKLLPFIRKEGC